jgi:flagellar hook-basal body complex protein FliE
MSDPLGLINSAGNVGGIRPPGMGAPRIGGNEGGPSFKDVLMKNIEQVNKLQKDAESAIEDLASGKRDDVDGVLIANKKAEMAFQLLQQVRNKLVDAYEEIKQMRV